MVLLEGLGRRRPMPTGKRGLASAELASAELASTELASTELATKLAGSEPVRKELAGTMPAETVLPGTVPAGAVPAGTGRAGAMPAGTVPRHWPAEPSGGVAKARARTKEDAEAGARPGER